MPQKADKDQTWPRHKGGYGSNLLRAPACTACQTEEQFGQAAAPPGNGPRHAKPAGAAHTHRHGSDRSLSCLDLGERCMLVLKSAGFTNCGHNGHARRSQVHLRMTDHIGEPKPCSCNNRYAVCNAYIHSMTITQVLTACCHICSFC